MNSNSAVSLNFTVRASTSTILEIADYRSTNIAPVEKHFTPTAFPQVQFLTKAFFKGSTNHGANSPNTEQLFMLHCINRMDNLSKLTTQIVVAVLDAKGEKRNTRGFFWQFTKLKEYFTHPFLSRNDLLATPNLLLANGKLTLAVEVMILEEKSNTAQQNGHSDQGIPNCSNANQFSVAKFTDVNFVVGGKEIKVHKNILLSTKSPAFAAMLELGNNANDRIEINDIDPRVFEVMIQYIYTGKIESLEQRAADLFLVAEKYQLALLKRTCERQLASTLSTESVVKMLEYADISNGVFLKRKCIDFIVDHEEDVNKGQLETLAVKRPKLMLEMFSQVIQKYGRVKKE